MLRLAASQHLNPLLRQVAQRAVRVARPPSHYTQYGYAGVGNAVGFAQA